LQGQPRTREGTLQLPMTGMNGSAWQGVWIAVRFRTVDTAG